MVTGRFGMFGRKLTWMMSLAGAEKNEGSEGRGDGELTKADLHRGQSSHQA